MGFFASVAEGPYRGNYGYLQGIEEHKGGKIGLLHTRDDDDVILHVNYEHLRPDTAGKR